MRLYPQPPILIRRTIEPTTLGGYSIGAGEDLFISIWNIHRSPQLWEEPAEFRPMRFGPLDGNIPNEVSARERARGGLALPRGLPHPTRGWGGEVLALPSRRDAGAPPHVRRRVCRRCQRAGRRVFPSLASRPPLPLTIPTPAAASPPPRW